MKMYIFIGLFVALSLLTGCGNPEEFVARNEAYIISNAGPLIVEKNIPTKLGCMLVLKKPFNDKWNKVSINWSYIPQCQDLVPGNIIKMTWVDGTPHYDGYRRTVEYWLTIEKLPAYPAEQIN